MSQKSQPQSKKNTTSTANTTNPNWGRTFKKAVQQGKSPWQTVQAIATRNNVPTNRVWTWLVKNHFAFAKKFNGQTFYFPCAFTKGPKAFAKPTEFNFWQWCVEFAFQQGWVTPNQVFNWTPQQTFWFVSQKLNNFYGKPAKFNPNANVPPFNFITAFAPVPPKPKTTKTNTKPTAKKVKPVAKKKTNTTFNTPNGNFNKNNNNNPYAFPFTNTNGNTKTNTRNRSNWKAA